MDQRAILGHVRTYYRKTLAEHGHSPRGVGWNGSHAQELRFAQLAKVIEGSAYSVADLGCGYGALFGYLKEQVKGSFEYVGLDVSEDMLTAAGDYLRGEKASLRLVSSLSELPAVDFYLSSGAFNIKGDTDEGAWRQYILHYLDALSEKSAKGFAINFLTSYSDPAFRHPGHYYADPLDLFDYCKQRLSKEVALLHDYSLYDFTLIVRRGGGKDKNL